ncbi:GYDIA family GHMP kinase [Paracrocinitomix mangrovi]|uniref:GYDIA family GHMP kinase n=1 Tax=Paracrocinitomix mangrovi TaxID=2862509 RepID=UPI001C8EC469|nr:GYDIA family GHMP kinase [Paracrocinitomix mangrovi]UKN02488.1 GYDIA family GHMP kinase [Paracrocinitomix mangrovi]
MIQESTHKTTTYQAAGKLMLFGEYLVLDGAKSLAFPLKYGQKLEVSPNENNLIRWESHGPDGIWYNAILDDKFREIESSDSNVTQVLKRLLKEISIMNPELHMFNDFKITADFNLKWGFGSSSTFISLLSQWSDIDPFFLLQESFGGSGYDLACATANGPIVYQILPDDIGWEEVNLSSELTNKWLFVYLGQKQSSKDEIEKFQKRLVTIEDIKKMNDIVDEALASNEIAHFESLINDSESLISSIIGRKMLKDHIFADYNYGIKSLGAWGGDYFLATFRDLEEAKNYFKSKGYDTMFTYDELIK